MQTQSAGVRTLLATVGAVGLLSGCGRQAPDEVVVYVAHDQTYSEPILQQFEAETGIKAKPAYDTEASKTTGLVQRLIAEAAHPVADVFWNNEQAQTLVLKHKGVLAPYVAPAAGTIPDRFKDADGMWTGFGARARVIIYNTSLVSQPPRSIFELTKPEWKARVAVALPLFGTTATHVAALFEVLGPEGAGTFVRELKRNEVYVATGNAHVRDLVAQGDVAVGLTDTDDANAGVLDGQPVQWLFPDQGPDQIGTLVIPNTVAMIRNCPHPANAKKLIDFLLRPDIELMLARSRALQIPLHVDTEAPDTVPRLADIKEMDIDFDRVAARLRETAEFIRGEFLE